MSTLRRRILLQAAKLFDLALMVFSFGLATVLVAHQTAATSLAGVPLDADQGGELCHLRAFSSRLARASFPPSVCTARSDSPRAGRRYWTSRRRPRSGAAIVLGAAIFLRIRMVTPLFILLFWVASTLAGAASRVLLRSVLAGIRRRGRNLREMVVVGTNPRAIRFARKIESSPELGYRIAGFVDGPWAGHGNFPADGLSAGLGPGGLPALPPRAGGG